MEITCIVCPLGCKMKIIIEKEKINITGHSCNRGIKYAQEEVTCPKRVVTTTVSLRNAREKRLAVKTSSPIDKDKIFEIIKLLRTVEVPAPVSIGQVVVGNILNSGVDIVSTMNIN